ncbi:MAG: hypothetical protein AABO57_07915 [Acidobacteriota bacterium]
MSLFEDINSTALEEVTQANIKRTNEPALSKAANVPLTSEPPFIWPEPRILEGLCSYSTEVPFDDAIRTADALFGTLVSPSRKGIQVLESWLDRNEKFQARLVVAVYPTCQTREEDLSRLASMAEKFSDRLEFRIKPYRFVTDRPSNFLVIVKRVAGDAYLVFGSSENLGFDPRSDGRINLVFRGDAVLVEYVRRYFDWLWVKSKRLTAEGVTRIPSLVLPEGSSEGERRWQEYLNLYRDESLEQVEKDETVQVDSDTGDVIVASSDGQTITPPSERIGLSKLDVIAERTARLYEQGCLVSIDKLSRIPPLDAPLDPSLFGDSAELEKGNVKRKVSMRISIIDKGILKEIEKRRQALRGLLNKFTFGLADNMRWMPNSARPFFESELKRINEEGQSLVADLLKGDAGSYVKNKQEALTSDINGMYHELNAQGSVSEDIIKKVMKELEERLTKAQSANFMPMLTYSNISFNSKSSTFASPWGQAYSLLSDIVEFPRKAMTDAFFLRGMNVPEDELTDAMNVANDAIVRDRETRKIKARCETELEIVLQIRNSPIDSRAKCELLWRVIDFDDFGSIASSLAEKEKKEPIEDRPLASPA